MLPLTMAKSGERVMVSRIGGTDDVRWRSCPRRAMAMLL